jgi:putative ABC transport system ATP-binding protein
VISLREISKSFFTTDVETRALQGVNLSIQPGEFIAICGPSGCGKSTLLSILGLLEPADAGEYILSGQDVSRILAAERARVRNQKLGFIFQGFHLVRDLSIVENVELPLSFRGNVSKSERRDRAIDALKRVGLEHRANHHPTQLSGGQQQRAAIARAVVGAPDVLLADEPTGNLDSKNGDAIMDLICELQSAGTTVVLVTHDSRYAARAARRVELEDGRVHD